MKNVLIYITPKGSTQYKIDNEEVKDIENLKLQNYNTKVQKSTTYTPITLHMNLYFVDSPCAAVRSSLIGGLRFLCVVSTDRTSFRSIQLIINFLATGVIL